MPNNQSNPWTPTLPAAPFAGTAVTVVPKPSAHSERESSRFWLGQMTPSVMDGVDAPLDVMAPSYSTRLTDE